jgi:hypothetical protein
VLLPVIPAAYSATSWSRKGTRPSIEWAISMRSERNVRMKFGRWILD